MSDMLGGATGMASDQTQGAMGLITGLTDSSYKKPTQYNTWQPSSTNMSNFDNSFGGTVQNNLAQGSAASPGWQTYLNQLTTNPYQQGAQTSANNAGQAYTNMGNTAVGNSNTMSNAGNQILQTSMDPQSELYKQQYQQMMDQTNANEAARGITNSGYGADLANEAGINFNSNWMNQQLGREATGINSASGAFTNAGQTGAAGAQSIATGGAQPLSTYNAGVSNLGQGLGTYGAGTNQQDQTALSQIMSYLGLGAQQANTQGNFDQQYWQDMNAYTGVENAQNAAMWGSVGNMISPQWGGSSSNGTQTNTGGGGGGMMSGVMSMFG